MRYLEERGIGFSAGPARVPIVPGAAIFDLAFGSASIRPDENAGYFACQQASADRMPQGNIGGGTGATVGKLLGPEFAMKGGLGSASTELLGGIIVGALVIVNALGDIIDPQTQQVLAGARHPLQADQHTPDLFGNTTIAVIASNATLTKAEASKVAQMAHDGLAHVIRPAHTMFDGDAIFTLALGTTREGQGDTAIAAQRTSMLGAAAATTLARAIIKAIHAAKSLHGIPAVSEITDQQEHN
jgi:L-aminopeptidase/D-esterase-like protein